MTGLDGRKNIAGGIFHLETNSLLVVTPCIIWNLVHSISRRTAIGLYSGEAEECKVMIQLQHSNNIIAF